MNYSKLFSTVVYIANERMFTRICRKCNLIKTIVQLDINGANIVQINLSKIK